VGLTGAGEYSSLDREVTSYLFSRLAGGGAVTGAAAGVLLWTPPKKPPMSCISILGISFIRNKSIH